MAKLATVSMIVLPICDNKSITVDVNDKALMIALNILSKTQSPSVDTIFSIPSRTPFVGSAFNVTRAGIHADGLLKNEEIYNIFDTDKFLNRPVQVAVSNTSGLAGIAHWINTHYRLRVEEKIDKNDPLVAVVKEWVDKEYERGRVTSITDDELEELERQVVKESEEREADLDTIVFIDTKSLWENTTNLLTETISIICVGVTILIAGIVVLLMFRKKNISSLNHPEHLQYFFRNIILL